MAAINLTCPPTAAGPRLLVNFTRVLLEDGPRGFGAHSDQERILESELHRFVRLNWEIVASFARASSAPVP